VHLGTIDETYRGDVGVIVTNNSMQTFAIHKGNRIAQFTVKPVYPIELRKAKELTDTERGEQGYGSSGK
jgi:dUTP pyrophosphatase